MEWFSTAWEWVVHFDRHLDWFLANYGLWTYAILFLIVFCETGLVLTPFLPGDSLLFAAGALAARSVAGDGYELNVYWLFVLLSIAAIVGDSVNYSIGQWVGPRAFSGRIRFLKKEYLDRTHQFFEKYGGKTIILARFVPIVRTYAPFVAGVGAMNYPKFLAYNVIGGIVWVGSFLFLGYLFGNLPIVKDNFFLVTLAIIVLSVLPIVYEWFKARRAAPAAKPPAEAENAAE